MFKHIIIFITLFLIANVTSLKAINGKQDAPHEGLCFMAHTVDLEKRTGLNLTPERQLNLKDGFQLNFDIKLRQEGHNYGYIFRIIVNDTLNIDLLSNLWLDRKHFSLIKNTEELFRAPITNIPNYLNSWIEIALKADVQKQEITVWINNEKTVISNAIPNLRKVSIFFGRNNNSRLYVNDVPPMNIRNIRIFDNKQKLIRNWPLFKHAKDVVYDEVNNEKATVTNPVWEIDKHIYWKKRGEIFVEGLNPQIAYDEKKGRIFIAQNKDLYTFSLHQNKFDTIVSPEGSPFGAMANSIIYNHQTEKLISYNINKNYLIEYDFNNQYWLPKDNEFYNTMIQHNQMIAHDLNELVIFGGYGVYEYNALLCKYKLDGSGWEVKDLSASITPRYLSAGGYSGNGKMLVFGGYGSKSGKQEESPQNHYDLNEIDVNTFTCDKIWEFTNDNLHQTFGNSMVIDKQKNCFYVLAYENDRNNTYIQLNRFGLDKPDKVLLGDSIPYKFHDVKSYCTLFMNQESNELITILYDADKNDNTRISIYSLSAPPLSRTEIHQHAPVDNNHNWVIYISVTAAIIFVLVILVMLSYFLYKKTSHKSGSIEDIFSDDNQPSIYQVKKRTSSILLLGSFQIIDVDGNDITGQFSYILRNLFLFILINTLKNGKGVTSHQIDETIWQNMDKSNAMNNRNVNMSKLRNVIKNLPGISIVSKNSYWYITIADEVFCDFAEILHLINEVEYSKSFDPDKIDRILELGISGGLLSNSTSPWLDSFKSEYSDSITDILTIISIEAARKKDLKLLLRIANVMLAIDSLDEEAIKLKCRSLYHLGKKRLAKECFNDFCNEFQKILDALPKFNFEDIIK